MLKESEDYSRSRFRKSHERLARLGVEIDPDLQSFSIGAADPEDLSRASRLFVTLESAANGVAAAAWATRREIDCSLKWWRIVVLLGVANLELALYGRRVGVEQPLVGTDMVVDTLYGTRVLLPQHHATTKAASRELLGKGESGSTSMAVARRVLRFVEGEPIGGETPGANSLDPLTKSHDLLVFAVARSSVPHAVRAAQIRRLHYPLACSDSFEAPAVDLTLLLALLWNQQGLVNEVSLKEFGRNGVTKDLLDHFTA